MRTKIDDMLERISPPMSRDRFDGLISTLCRNKMILMKPSGDATVWTVLDCRRSKRAGFWTASTSSFPMAAVAEGGATMSTISFAISARIVQSRKSERASPV
jgi:hypothetical protein